MLKTENFKYKWLNLTIEKCAGSLIAPPKSPRSGRLLHAIPHVWVKYRKMTLNKKCDYCKQALAFKSWEKCSSCK